MYLRHTIRKKDGKVHRYWRLVRSVRVGRRVIQQTVAHLGELDERGRMEARALALAAGVLSVAMIVLSIALGRAQVRRAIVDPQGEH